MLCILLVSSRLCSWLPLFPIPIKYSICINDQSLQKRVFCQLGLEIPWLLVITSVGIAGNYILILLALCCKKNVSFEIFNFPGSVEDSEETGKRRKKHASGGQDDINNKSKMIMYKKVSERVAW